MIRYKLTDICEFQGGSQPPKNEWIKVPRNGYIRMLQIRDFTQNIDKIEYVKISNNIKTCEENDILIARYGASIGKILTGLTGAYNVAMIKTIPNEKLLIKSFLYHFLKSNIFQNTISSVGSRAAQAGFNKEDLDGIFIDLPSINEQKEIVSKLDKICSMINIKKKELSIYTELIQSQYNELIEEKKYDNKLKEFISRSRTEIGGERNLPVLSITKENGMVFQEEKFKKRIASVDTSKYKVVPRNKLVQGIHIDERNFAIQDKCDYGLVSPAYKIWDIDENKAVPEMVAYALRTDRIMLHISSKSKGAIKRRESISYDDFMNLPINLPSLKEQIEFLEFRNKVLKIKTEQEKELKKLEELQFALMQEYFG